MNNLTPGLKRAAEAVLESMESVTRAAGGTPAYRDRDATLNNCANMLREALGAEYVPLSITERGVLLASLHHVWDTQKLHETVPAFRSLIEKIDPANITKLREKFAAEHD